jgi:hypothetical protein
MATIVANKQQTKAIKILIDSQFFLKKKTGNYEMVFFFFFQKMKFSHLILITLTIFCSLVLLVGIRIHQTQVCHFLRVRYSSVLIYDLTITSC